MGWLSQVFGFFRSFQFWIVIAPWEQGLRVRLGRVAATLNPGPHFRLPFLDRIFVQSTRLRTIADSGQTMATMDGKVLTITVAVSYAIADIRQLYLTVSNPEATLLWQVQGIVSDVVSTRLSTALTPSAIEGAVRPRLPHNDWGLKDVTVMVTTFAFVRTLRLISDGYKQMSSANELEQVNLPMHP